MDRAVLNSMTAAEQRLVAETSRDAMAGLDEEEVLELHARVRRARSKYVSKYRRGASGAFVKRGGRGFSYPKNQRDRDKAAVFETALASVSKEVGKHAARAAAELKESRLAAAGTGSSGPETAVVETGPRKRAASRPRGATKTTGGLKKDASSRAAGARRQAKRDSR